MDICFHNEHILRSIGFEKQLDIINQNDTGNMPDTISDLFKGFEVAFNELLGTEGNLNKLVQLTANRRR